MCWWCWNWCKCFDWSQCPLFYFYILFQRCDGCSSLLINPSTTFTLWRLPCSLAWSCPNNLQNNHLQVLYLPTCDHRMLTHVFFQCVCVCVWGMARVTLTLWLAMVLSSLSLLRDASLIVFANSAAVIVILHPVLNEVCEVTWSIGQSKMIVKLFTADANTYGACPLVVTYWVWLFTALH